MNKILITGGIGFIGTNLVNLLHSKGKWIILNVDIQPPKIKMFNSVWKKVDLRNREDLMLLVKSFQPDYVIHLAARTDLRGKNLEDYDANMNGVSNLLDALEYVPGLKRAIFASSMYAVRGRQSG